MLIPTLNNLSNSKVRRVKMGKPLRLTDSELDDAAKVTKADIKYTAEQWRLLTPAYFALLLNAIPFIRGPVKSRID